MRRKTFLLLCIAFITLFIGVSPLQAGHYYYKQISLKDGLPSTVRCILTDKQGFVWIGTRSGLGRYDGHELKKYVHQSNNPHSIPHNLIYQLIEDVQNNIWILTDKGVARYQRQSDDFLIPTDETGNNIIAYSVCLTDDGVLFGSKNKIFFYNYQDATFRLLQTFDLEPNYNVTLLSLWDKRTLLCCSRWQGLLLLDLNTGKCRRPPFDCGKEIMNELNIIARVSKKLNVTPNGGLNCLTHDGKLLATYTTHNSSLSNNVVLSLAEREGEIWIGTDGGGINSFDQKTNTFHHYPTTYGEKVTSITNFSENELLLSCFNKGVFTFNKRTAQMQPFPIINDSISKREFSSGDLVNLYATKDNIYILGAKVYIYNKHTRQTSILYAPQIDIQRQIAMQAIYSDDTHLYLMGTNNLFKLNFKTNELSSLVNMKEGDDFTSACRDDKGNFWIGSNFGLLFYNKQTGKTEKIHTNLFNSVSSLAYDKKGKVWIGAQNMFFAYIINEKRFVILDESDGVPSNELIFTPIPALRTPNLYMGGTMGLVRINTDIIFESNSSPILKLLEVKLNGKSTLKQVNNNCISIPWNHSSFNIKVIADEKNSFRKHLFRYVITGKDKMVIESYLQTLELGTLASGEYTISVSCDTSNGEWSQPIEILTIIVSPPWWKSTWFIILCIFFAFLVAGVGFFSLIRKKENRLKREMREHEKKIYEEKIRFLINISHELRTPLTLIYASLKRILNKEVKQDELPEYLQGAFKQANQMKDIINIVLDARKMEVGQEVLHISSHPLHKWIQEVAETFQTASKAKEIEITYDFDDSIQYIAYDDTKCKVVLSNLIMNALKYSPNQTRIVIKTIRTNESIQVHVQDQGIGLDNVDIKKLFTRFYQGKHNEGGSGIGLSYAKMLIDLHGGRMGAFNNKDRGATFFYEIPANLQEQEVSCPQHSYLNELLSSPEEEEKIESEAFSLQGYSLLIVEDKQDLREFLKSALKDKFKKIYQAENGLVALEVIKQQQPDIIVSDVMMPQMNGYQLCKEIKENLNISHIPVILLTARADSESQMLGYKLGADAYLPKPFEMEMLLSVIQNQMRNREYIKSRYRGNQFILSPQEATFSNADEQFMIKLNEMIDQNLSQPDLDVKFLTTQMAMSRTSLYNKIKELTGMGANDYINRRRIDKAIILLTQSDMSITEISEQVGFTYQRYFSTLFKEMKGMTPSQFRAQHGSTQQQSE